MEQKGHVVKGLQVMQRMRRGALVDETKVTTETQGQGEGVKTGKLLAAKVRGGASGTFPTQG